MLTLSAEHGSVFGPISWNSLRIVFLSSDNYRKVLKTEIFASY